MPALQGFIVEWPLATPTIGLSKSLSPNPTARNIARLGERATPWVMMRLRRLLAMILPNVVVGEATLEKRGCNDTGCPLPGRALSQPAGGRATRQRDPGEYQRHPDEMVPSGAFVEEHHREQCAEQRNEVDEQARRHGADAVDRVIVENRRRQRGKQREVADRGNGLPGNG